MRHLGLALIAVLPFIQGCETPASSVGKKLTSSKIINGSTILLMLTIFQKLKQRSLQTMQTSQRLKIRTPVGHTLSEMYQTSWKLLKTILRIMSVMKN